jgi:1,4-alpha-glucan branching enzyme
VSLVSRGRVGDLAIVLHSHMPYVEGFGTYPFGEEWLFDAVARSYLPVLDVAEGVTITITPVLADQLEASGVAERLRRFVGEHRLRACEAEAEEIEDPFVDACRAEAARYHRALRRLRDLGDDLLSPFRDAQEAGRVELVASAASHAVLPLLATRGGRRLQVDAGLRSHRRRFGRAGGFWLPECAYDPGLEELLAERGLRFFCVD